MAAKFSRLRRSEGGGAPKLTKPEGCAAATAGVTCVRLLTVTWHGLGGCGAKRKGLTTAAGIISGMYCTAGDLEPALHSQLAKTDGEVTNLVSCDTSVLHTRSPQGRSACGGPPFQLQGRVILVGSSSGTARGWPGGFRSWPLWERG